MTQRGSNRQDTFRQTGDRRVYLQLIEEQRLDSGVRVLAYCLMRNHVHWILIPERGDSLAVLFRRVHGRYAQYFNARYGRSGHLWQGRYFSCPLSAAHLDVALQYVEMNPVRAGLVSDALNYEWSSARFHCGTAPDPNPLIDRDFWLTRGGAEAWKQMLVRAHANVLIHLLRRCSYAERPFGPEAFVAEFEEKLGRKWKRWPFDGELADAQFRLLLTSLTPLSATAT